MDETQMESNVAEKKLRYPISVFLIIANEFCERFCFYGMRTILALYLVQRLDYTEQQASVTFHAFTMLVFATCLLGAILSDSWLGRYNTILYLSIVYAIGCVLVAMGAVPQLKFHVEASTMAGLLIIALGSGGIKPCVAAFGGDQFKLPEQDKQMLTFFSLFYLSINAGSLISSVLTPILREDVHCFEQNDCYSLAFGVPAILMAISVVIFVNGKSMYHMEKPYGNMISDIAKCTWSAITSKRDKSQVRKREHWLDSAAPKFNAELINNSKILYNIILIFLPVPLFWALYEQQASRWTFQATRLDGDIGFYVIKPDQVQVINSLLVILLIPIFDFFIYPLLAQIGIRRPLQKMIVGGFLAALAFAMSGILETQIEQIYRPAPKSGTNQLRMFNSLPCHYTIHTNIPDHPEIMVGTMSSMNKIVKVDGLKEYNFSMEPTSKSLTDECPVLRGVFKLNEADRQNFYFNKYRVLEVQVDMEEPPGGKPLLRVLTNFGRHRNVTIHSQGVHGRRSTVNGDQLMVKVEPLGYQVRVDGETVATVKLRSDSVATLRVFDRNGVLRSSLDYLKEPNVLSMLWILPQYVVISLAEIMFSITGLSFTYSQAPNSMKSIMQAIWLMMVAIGNLVDVFIMGLLNLKSQTAEYFLFAFLMVVDMLVFVCIAYWYVPSDNGVWSVKNQQKKLNVM